MLWEKYPATDVSLDWPASRSEKQWFLVRLHAPFSSGAVRCSRTADPISRTEDTMDGFRHISLSASCIS